MSRDHKVADTFDAFASGAGRATGHWLAFVLALVIVVVWFVGGLLQRNLTDDTWQLLINTSTTIITFLMVFLIQHTADKDMLALHVKLDRLLAATEAPTEDVEGIDQAPESELRAVREDE